MTSLIQGNFITLSILANEGQPEPFQLPSGYTYEKIRIVSQVNTSYLIPYLQIAKGEILTFPPIDSKSPCTVQPVITDTTKNTELKILIEKFGQIPDTHYFDKAFEPILVTGEDGAEYKVIPSDQFK